MLDAFTMQTFMLGFKQSIMPLLPIASTFPFFFGPGPAFRFILLGRPALFVGLGSVWLFPAAWFPVLAGCFNDFVLGKVWFPLCACFGGRFVQLDRLCTGVEAADFVPGLPTTGAFFLVALGIFPGPLFPLNSYQTPILRSVVLKKC